MGMVPQGSLLGMLSIVNAKDMKYQQQDLQIPGTIWAYSRMQ